MAEFLDKLVEATAWTMDKPPAYGAFHISYTLIGFLICAVLAWKLRKVSDKTARWILFSLGLVLTVMELYKQIFATFIGPENSYDWGKFPFHLCSIPMYMCLIVPWLKKGKLQRGMYSFMVLYNLLGGAISFAEPSGLLHDYWFLTIHALFWHMALVFIGLFVCFSQRGGSEKEDYWGATKTFVALCGAAFIINFALQQLAGANINMFFVGPGNSTIVVFKQISERFGWVVSTVLYIPSVALGAYIIFRIIYRCTHKTKADALQKVN